MTVAYVYKGIGHEIDKDAAWDYIRNGYLLAPRTVLRGRTKLLPPQLPSVSIDLDNLTVILQQTFVNVMGHMAGSHRSVMFSGGFDSMLIAQLIQRCGAQVAAVTVQFDDFNPVTVGQAVRLAREMELPHRIIYVTIPEFVSAFELLAGITEEPLLDLDLCAVYAALKNYHSQFGGEVFISGMGTDQWFGNHSLEVWPGGLAGRLDWAVVNEKAHHQVAQVHGCSFVFPFLSVPMLALSQQIPAGMKKNKRLLRSLIGGNVVPHRSGRPEMQIPDPIRRILVKVYGHRAWHGPVSCSGERGSADEQVLRQIVLGLWLEKTKGL